MQKPLPMAKAAKEKGKAPSPVEAASDVSGRATLAVASTVAYPETEENKLKTIESKIPLRRIK